MVIVSPCSSVEKVGTVVIGAGVIGLAVARSLSMMMIMMSHHQQGQQQQHGEGGEQVLVLERNHQIGAETSSRNSEVVHGGLYYPTNSYKAQFCVGGRQLLYDFCESRGVYYNKIGKLVVAKNDEQRNTTIRALQEQAYRNGYHETKILSPADVRFMEPNIKCGGGALWSPETGIVDSHNFMLSLLADAEEHGTTLALGTHVENARLITSNSTAPPKVQLYASGMWIQPEAVVNCAGLWADHVAALIHNHNDEPDQQHQQQQQQQQDAKHWWKPPKQYYARGTYFQLHAKSPFSHLIYPVPDKRGGLGVHATLDANNRVRFGPDVEWLPYDIKPDEIDYQPNQSRVDSFYQAIRDQYWPDLPDDSLTADYTGVRPKLAHPDVPESGFGTFQDFSIAGPREHGIPGLIHLFGMESPGLTSSMAIGDYVAKLIIESKTS